MPTALIVCIAYIAHLLYDYSLEHRGLTEIAGATVVEFDAEKWAGERCYSVPVFAEQMTYFRHSLVSAYFNDSSEGISR